MGEVKTIVKEEVKPEKKVQLGHRIDESYQNIFDIAFNKAEAKALRAGKKIDKGTFLELLINQYANKVDISKLIK